MGGEKILFKNESFDYVISFDVLEHIPNVDKHIKEVFRVLKPGGKYLFLTPNKCVNKPYLIYHTKSLTNWHGGPYGHVSLQTKRSMKKLFKKNGFKVLFPKVQAYQDYLKKRLGIFKFVLHFIDIGLYCVATKKPRKNVK
jgi:ubiquinone/menaquinone biosynthesis C-methylase UbiE